MTEQPFDLDAILAQREAETLAELANIRQVRKSRSAEPQPQCTGTTMDGSRCRDANVFENGRCTQHGGAGLLVGDRRWIERARKRLQRILLRSRRNGVVDASTQIAQLLGQFHAGPSDA